MIDPVALSGKITYPSGYRWTRWPLGNTIGHLTQAQNELDALAQFFQDKVQSVFKLFDILYTPNSYEIGHVFATSGFREIEISNPQLRALTGR